MNVADQRSRMRAILNGTQCVLPASVYDPLSARVAESVGFQVGLLGGSVVSATTLAAPDLVVHTATEYADQIRRIMRVSRLSLLVDADSGYGNALNVMRTVEEFEHAGVSAVAVEDTVLPIQEGQVEDEERLVSVREAAGKLRAAVAARSDPSLVIVGRTAALRSEGLERTLARTKAYAEAGVDAIFIVWPETLEQVRAIHQATGLPIVAGSQPGILKREDLAACGARIMLQGHHPGAAAAKAFREVYTHLFNGGAPADLKPKLASDREMAELLRDDVYKQRLRDYVR